MIMYQLICQMLCIYHLCINNTITGKVTLLQSSSYRRSSRGFSDSFFQSHTVLESAFKTMTLWFHRPSFSYFLFCLHCLLTQRKITLMVVAVTISKGAWLCIMTRKGSVDVQSTRRRLKVLAQSWSSYLELPPQHAICHCWWLFLQKSNKKRSWCLKKKM